MRQQRCRYLDELDAAHIARSRKTSDISHNATTECDYRRITIGAHLYKLIDEGGITGMGAAIASAIDDALGGSGAITELPITPARLFEITRNLDT